MARKTKRETQQEAINNLVKQMFMAVGLYMSNNYIFDQDTSLPWKFKNKFMRYDTLVIHNNEELFDPLLNKPMVRDLFNITLAKNEEYREMYVRSVCPVFEKQKKALIIYTDGGVLRTRFYKHEVLMYYEGCFLLADMLTQDNLELLEQIDLFMSELIPKKSIRKRKEIFDGLYRTARNDY